MDAQEIFEKGRSAKDFADIHNLIREIEAVLQAPQFDVQQARHVIGKENDKHGENIAAYRIATHQLQGNMGNSGSVSVEDAHSDELIQDLQWKHYYLNAKLRAKSIEEIEKEWQKLRS